MVWRPLTGESFFGADFIAGIIFAAQSRGFEAEEDRNKGYPTTSF
jgi:hypothetical protein